MGSLGAPETRRVTSTVPTPVCGSGVSAHRGYQCDERGEEGDCSCAALCRLGAEPDGVLNECVLETIAAAMDTPRMRAVLPHPAMPTRSSLSIRYMGQRHR